MGGDPGYKVHCGTHDAPATVRGSLGQRIQDHPVRPCDAPPLTWKIWNCKLKQATGSPVECHGPVGKPCNTAGRCAWRSCVHRISPLVALRTLLDVRLS